jgi:hypothetical protein
MLILFRAILPGILLCLGCILGTSFTNSGYVYFILFGSAFGIAGGFGVRN